ncbi:hypothetical protein LHJ74_32675 [Streptomyces sp. N2-109]|uniref:Uncharacterized protein n=1 Tax=Streptomyces gossypii TaxID=2883101 RepID=A0ABT2K3R3_9ACTN|nr:hypothetical protein [Streptomyces gossypii]MCT2594611.1 hypothetical protein [Streptomyces gossypii]
MSPTQNMIHLLPLAAKEVDDNKVTPGVLGFLVFAVMGLAVWMLLKSMNTQMKKIDFEEEGGPPTGRASRGARIPAPTGPVEGPPPAGRDG